MGTKNNPSKFDCYVNAEPDEPMFVLLARDLAAPSLLEEWALIREEMIDAGMKPASDHAMITEARECAEAMRAWRKIHRPSDKRAPA